MDKIAGIDLLRLNMNKVRYTLKDSSESARTGLYLKYTFSAPHMRLMYEPQRVVSVLVDMYYIGRESMLIAYSRDNDNARVETDLLKRNFLLAHCLCL